MFDENIPEDLNRLSYAIIGAAMCVHRFLGPGYVESAYEEALVAELEIRNIPFQRQVPIDVCFKDLKVCTYRVDMLVEDRVVVELKAVESILQVHRAQVLSYLKAGSFPLGLLINFNVARLEDGVSRLIWRDRDEYDAWLAWKRRSR